MNAQEAAYSCFGLCEKDRVLQTSFNHEANSLCGIYGDGIQILTNKKRENSAVSLLIG